MLVFFYVHNKAGVGGKQFLKSMIPHQAAAVLMVEKAFITDSEIKELANKNITSQQAKIQPVKNKLKELNKKVQLL